MEILLYNDEPYAVRQRDGDRVHILGPLFGNTSYVFNIDFSQKDPTRVHPAGGRKIYSSSFEIATEEESQILEQARTEYTKVQE